MGKTYQDVMQAIRDGVEACEVEAMIADEHTNVTAAQMADLRDELASAVITAAGQGGGVDEVRRIAERGWPGLSGPANEAIKSAAAREVADA